MTKEALKLALEALKNSQDYKQGRTFAVEAVEDIEEALAQPTSGDYALGYAEGFNDACKNPEQEPVGYGMWDTMLGKGNRMMMVRLDKGQDGCSVPLYTSPPKEQQSCDKRTWVDLTDDEIQQCYKAAYKVVQGRQFEIAFARALETYLREKNT